MIRSSYHLKRGNCSCKKCKAQVDKLKNSSGYKDIVGTYWSSLKSQARKRGIDFKIDVEYAWKIYIKQNKKCALTGMKIKFGKNKKDHLEGSTTASLDRIDSSKGYTKNNIQWVHKWINIMKSDHKQEVFLELCQKISLSLIHI